MFQSFQIAGGPDNVADRTKALRRWMEKTKVDAVLVPRADAHQGEYVPPSAERLAWLTGFTGSAGIAAVTHKAALLAIDGRYTVQAAAQTDTQIFEVALLPRPKLADWLSDKLTKGAVIGFDPWLHTSGEIDRLTQRLAGRGIKLKAMRSNPIDKVWGDARPPEPSGNVTVQPLRLSGVSAADKIASVQATLKDAKQRAAVLTLPDSICWLLNIRGSDVAHNPVALCFAIVPATGKVDLFIAGNKLDKTVRNHLAGVAKLHAPDAFKGKLKELARGKHKIRVDADTAADVIRRTIGAKSVEHGPDPCILPKAIKSAAEIAGCRAAHVRDGVAIVNFLAWLDAHAPGIDEITAVRTLEEMRATTGALRDISFDTIAGSGPNGAIVHYRVSEQSNRKLKAGELFLIDSGGQYQDGTTDITRTVAIGPPSNDMRRMFTAVLKGHIAIATARFPKGTRGLDLDPYARRALWDIGADYDHGTGHGIGSFLSVHEGPQSISRAGHTVLQPGMLLSNEPGYYRQGAFGIRIENVVLVGAAEQRSGEDRAMMHFETLTLAPIDRRLIDAAALTDSERNWIDSYHANVRKVLSPLLDEATLLWLDAATAKL